MQAQSGINTPEGTARDVVRLNPQDNIVIALRDLQAGERPALVPAPLAAPVARGHKIAITAIQTGENVIRYGQIIGQAKCEIAPGAHIHVHNLGMGAHQQDYAHASANAPLPALSDGRTFDGYHRSDGKVGTRNYVGILTTVNCSDRWRVLSRKRPKNPAFWTTSQMWTVWFRSCMAQAVWMSGKDEGYATLFRTLAGYTQHPNFGGILLIGLGCEVMQVADLVGGRPIRADGALRYMTIQTEGGTRRTIERGLEELRGIAELANQAERSPAPVSAITVGMQCGGSDGYSGITANPALGYASDLLIRHGGTTILSGNIRDLRGRALADPPRRDG